MLRDTSKAQAFGLGFFLMPAPKGMPPPPLSGSDRRVEKGV